MVEVLLLKGPSEDANFQDPYVTELEEAGYSVSLIPVLEFSMVNQMELQARLNSPGEYSAVVFTSRRAVQAVKNAMGEEVAAVWRLKPVFVVGEATARLVKDSLGMESVGSDSGSAESLAGLIKQSNVVGTTAKVLFPKGNLAKETIGNMLTSDGFLVDELVVYETRPNSHLGSLLDLTRLPEWVVFFSPSGAKSSLPFLSRTKRETEGLSSPGTGNRGGLSSLESGTKEDPRSLETGTKGLSRLGPGTKVLAIGPTTMSAVESLGFVVDRVAGKPSPTGVRQALTEWQASPVPLASDRL